MTRPLIETRGHRGLTRRGLVLGLPLLAVGCTASGSPRIAEHSPTPAPIPSRYVAMYAAVPNERFPIPAVDLSRIDPRFYRQQVAYPTPEQPGTIVVDTNSKHLYLVQDGGRAMRYGVGVGRAGFGWSGTATIQRKATWPTWTPTGNMMERDPELRRYAGGMEPGLDNPLGARALYLFKNGRDTLYRLHGTNEPWSIGKAMSSGCIRLLNQDAIDLYRRTPRGTRVVVLEHASV
ncbi:L,D-transpeptidase [Lutibaculum baratangense]|uniref:L,D-TPase catalytic domain-containing protein n=1 Tax=Lutibaculum baratangense AMV1 TaxID=631454 RepID=V4RES1_9HYPH|nr:L,D-transpeptidase [Lutibaculum baratangense]ESR24641.1 hypothetical protein N177_2321 [Lutibaculum baratangense AMV1]